MAGMGPGGSVAPPGKSVIQFDAEVTHRQQEKLLSALTKPGVTLEMIPVERQNG
jgi:hypothetical protein